MRTTFTFFNFNKIVVAILLCQSVTSCKKAEVESSDVINNYQATSSNATIDFPSTRKTLLVTSRLTPASDYTIRTMTNLDGVPVINTIFKSEDNYSISCATRSSNVNRMYFAYTYKNDLPNPEKEGIWSVSLDGKTKTLLLKTNLPNYVSDIEVDRTAHKIYWMEDGFVYGTQAKFRRIDELDGKNFTTITFKINGVPIVSPILYKFTIDQVAKRIYFVYITGNSSLRVGCSDLNGNIIIPVVTTDLIDHGVPTANILSVDNKNQRLYITAKGSNVVKFVDINPNNQFPAPAITDPVLFSNTIFFSTGNNFCFDFQASKAYAAGAFIINNQQATPMVGSLDLNGNNPKVLVKDSWPNYVDFYTDLDGIFSW